MKFNCGDSPYLVLIAGFIADEVKLEILISQPNCQLISFNSTEQLKLALISSKFDLIIIDTCLIKAPIIEFAKNQASANGQTPVIGLVETMALAERKALIQDGFDDVLEKPLSAVKFYALCKLWLGDDDLTTTQAAIKQLLTKVKGNRELVLTMWQQLFAELPLQITALNYAESNRAFQDIYTLIHNLNGTAKVCCLAEIETITRDIEKCLTANHYDNINQQCLRLLTKLDRLLNDSQHVFAYIAAL